MGKFSILAAVVALALSAVHYFDISSHLKFSEIRSTYYNLVLHVENHPYLAPLIFIVLYVTVALSTIPGLLVLDLLAGMFFIEWWGAVIITVGGILGSLFFYLTMKWMKVSWKSPKMVRALGKMQTFLQERGVLFLFLVRLMPFFPFWLVSVALSLLKVRVRRFLWTSTLGFFTLAMVMTSLGKGIKDSLESETEMLSLLLTPKMMIAALLLVIFMILPFILKKRKREEMIKKEENPDQE